MESSKQKHFNAVVVVEGRDDTKRLRQFFPGIETIETNGSEVSDETLMMIKKLSQTREIIVFTDPDFNGERIRKLVTEVVPNAKQAFITRKEGEPTKRGNSLGVEHASEAALERALSDLHEVQPETSDLTKHDYNALGLGIGPNARKLRERVGIKLGIGYGNAQQFYRRLEMFGISYQEVKEAVDSVK
ncbi:ribonuclease M5 [Lactobacillus colini]|uniref:Ribonuclease M5 n=1 Tax=Lactobacillus colini TaxID=1819254 RepID=A0ABS4MCC3_9LACO|nr:ribonuclease M5 [Lactobacillus colini]MBP2057336.1 ribonuclease M5 [Lactobacillus colini]